MGLRKKYTFRKLGIQLLTTRRLIENPLYSFFYKRNIKKKTKSRMPVLLIEPTNACNANCRTCCRADMKREIGFMPMGVYEKIVKDAVDMGVKSITLTGFGEPFMDPKIFEKIDIAKKHDLNVVIITNGSLIGKVGVEKIVNSGVDEISFSIDSVNKAFFEHIRRNLNYDVVEKNLMDLIKTRKSKKPIVSITSVLIDRDFKRIKNVYRKFDKIVDYILVQFSHNWTGKQNELGSSSSGMKINKWPCPYLWWNLMIRWDGDVSLCCFDFDSKIVLGNVGRQSLSDIWNGEKINKMRELHLNGEKGKVDICKGCSVYPNWWADWSR
ncbi:MAG: radical SAM protein [Candidatus Aenigmarchaeota archaeon]|nr:radical SAM protein [Candidatus Aenigmarchaeota archaeon]